MRKAPTLFTNIIYDIRHEQCVIRTQGRDDPDLTSTIKYNEEEKLLILSGRTFNQDFQSIYLLANTLFRRMDSDLKQKLFVDGEFSRFVYTINNPYYIIKYIPVYAAVDHIKNSNIVKHDLEHIINELPQIHKSDRWYLPSHPRAIMVIDIRFPDDEFRTKLNNKRTPGNPLINKFRLALRRSLKEDLGVPRPLNVEINFEDNVINHIYYYLKGMPEEYVETIFEWTSQYNDLLKADNDIIAELRGYGFNILENKQYDIKSKDPLPVTFERNKVQNVYKLYDGVFAQIEALETAFHEHIRKQFIYICSEITGIVDERISFPDEKMLLYLSIYKKHMKFFDLDYPDLIERIFKIRMNLRLIASINMVRNEEIKLTSEQTQRLKDLNNLIYSMKSFIEKYIENPDVVFIDMLDSITRSLTLMLNDTFQE